MCAGRQARKPRKRYRVGLNIEGNPIPNVGVSLLAIAVYQPGIFQLTHRYREQAHSYNGIYAVQGDWRMTSTKFIGLKPGC
jgi:hypothetical protein